LSESGVYITLSLHWRGSREAVGICLAYRSAGH